MQGVRSLTPADPILDKLETANKVRAIASDELALIGCYDLLVLSCLEAGLSRKLSNLVKTAWANRGVKRDNKIPSYTARSSKL